MQQIISEGKGLCEGRYAKHVEPIVEFFEKEKKRPLGDHLLATTGFLMKNFEEHVRERLSRTRPEMKMISETTTSDDIAFIDYAFDLIAAVVPNLIAEQIFSVQPMERRRGQVFYLDVIADTAKGKVKVGDKLATPQSGFNADYSYPLQTILDETIGAGTGSTPTFTGNLVFPSPIPSTLVITAMDVSDNLMTVTDDGSGNLVGDIAAGTNTIVYTSGAFNVTFNANVKNLTDVLITYEYRMDLHPAQTPQIKFQITDSPVTAQFAQLGSTWILHAAFDLKKAHNLSAQDVLLESQAGLLRRAIDAQLMEIVRRQAAGGLFTFDFQAPTGVSKAEHYESLSYILAEMSATIGDNTRMTGGNILLCGRLPWVILSGNDKKFKSAVPAGKRPAGSFIAGTYEDYLVVYNPDFPIDEMVMGAKGDNFLESNFVYAPYLPFFTSEVDWLNFFENQQGMGTAYGHKMIRPAGYTKMTINQN